MNGLSKIAGYLSNLKIFEEKKYPPSLYKKSDDYRPPDQEYPIPQANPYVPVEPDQEDNVIPLNTLNERDFIQWFLVRPRPDTLIQKYNSHTQLSIFLTEQGSPFYHFILMLHEWELQNKRRQGIQVVDPYLLIEDEICPVVIDEKGTVQTKEDYNEEKIRFWRIHPALTNTLFDLYDMKNFVSYSEINIVRNLETAIKEKLIIGTSKDTVNEIISGNYHNTRTNKKDIKQHAEYVVSHAIIEELIREGMIEEEYIKLKKKKYPFVFPQDTKNENNNGRKEEVE